MKADDVPVEVASHKECSLYGASRLKKISNGHQDGFDGHGMRPLGAFRGLNPIFSGGALLGVRNTTTNCAQSLGLPIRLSD